MFVPCLQRVDSFLLSLGYTLVLAWAYLLSPLSFPPPSPGPGAEPLPPIYSTHALALAAHCVARALPPERYEGFIGALFAAQDRWAFARGVDHLAEMAKIAALAGMTREQFDAAARDEALRRFVLEQRLRGEQEHRVEATPTFVFGSVKQAGNLGFDRFAQLLAEASRA